MILALDTSTLTLSVALVARAPEGLDVVAEQTHGPPRKQSELLPGVLGELLSTHGLRLDELEGIMVGRGPGSFTGLRIGIATAKALAYSRRLPLGGVSSLAAVACAGPADKELFCVAVARRGELYVGRYRRVGRTVTAAGAEVVATVPALVEWVAASADAVVLGPAVEEYGRELVDQGLAEGRLLRSAPYPRARHLVELAPVPTQYDEQSVFSLEPHYVGPSEAEKNPKFPPLPGPAPTARLRDDEEGA